MIRRYRFWILAGLLLATAGFIASLWTNKNFRLVSSTPRLGRTVSTSTGTILLQFNREIDDSVEYTDNLEGDTEIVKGIDVESKQILIRLILLEKDKKYELALKDIRSKNGETINLVDINFTAVYIPFNDLTKEQKQLELSQTDKDNNEEPVMAILPHQGGRYYLSGEYSENDAGEPIFIINAQLFLLRTDLSSRQAAIDKYKSSVREYLSSNGFNPDDFFIRYIINEPPATAN